MANQQHIESKTITSEQEVSQDAPDYSSSSPQTRKRVQTLLYSMVKERCSIEDPSKESKALEALLFRTMRQNPAEYEKMSSGDLRHGLKNLESKVLVKRLRKLSGFRNSMVLELPTLYKALSKQAKKRTNVPTRSKQSTEALPHSGQSVDQNSNFPVNVVAL